MKLLFDIETDDLKATRIWCIVCKDLDTSLDLMNYTRV